MSEINLENSVLKLTLGDLVQQFTEEDLQQKMPVFLQDVDADTRPLLDTYQGLLADGSFAEAETFRTAHPELETRIWDAYKANSMMAYAAFTYLYAKDQKQQCAVGKNEPEGQIEGDIWFKETDEIANGKNLYIPFVKTPDGYTEFSLFPSAVDHLESSDSNASLSANMGRILNEKLMSFENAKFDIVSSELGQELGLTQELDENGNVIQDSPNTSTWNEVINSLISCYKGNLSLPVEQGIYEYPSGFYHAFAIDTKSIYEQGKKDALKVSSGIGLYPNTAESKEITGGWLGSVSVSAQGASKQGTSNSGSAQTTNKIDLTDATYITATFSASCNPTASGSGSKNSMGSASASLYVTSDGSTSLLSKGVSWNANSGAKVATIDVSNLSGNHFIHVSLGAYGGYITNTASRYWYGTSTVSLSSISVGAK